MKKEKINNKHKYTIDMVGLCFGITMVLLITIIINATLWLIDL